MQSWLWNLGCAILAVQSRPLAIRTAEELTPVNLVRELPPDTPWQLYIASVEKCAPRHGAKGMDA